MASGRELVRHACRSLKDVRANLTGAVLNAMDMERQGYPYYQRYYGKREADSIKPPAA